MAARTLCRPCQRSRRSWRVTADWNNRAMNYTAENLLIKSKDTGDSGVFTEINAAAVGWEYLNMAALRLNRGETYSGDVGEHEHVSVILGGRCNLNTSAGNFEN